MRDLKVNGNFELHLDDTNDLATVTGRESFEQALGFILSRYFTRILGETGPANIVEKVRLQAERVAMNSQLVDEIEGLRVQFTDTPGEIEVAVYYTVGEPYREILTE
ncbi:hypothetical protein [Halorubellus litoreus]|uniref:Uncharacterized protein n=1 Tax=Halorubellus litoreus TaxID=755308 RepID=A0ABD5VH21_9EURY